MAKKRPIIQRAASRIGANQAAQPAIPAGAALSFLKDTKGAVTWSIRDLANTLKISHHDAEQVVALLAAQGYIRPEKKEWMTTPAGESVSDAKTPRFARESVEQAVDALKERIKQANKDSQAAFRITDAVAFGDFLLKDRARVQAADVGIGLVQRGEALGELRSATVVRAERQFLKQLRVRSGLLHLRPHAEWMSKRLHVSLMAQL